eukprot:TRINITY_DN1500_c0_g1_i2.p1 TRINITY_DN1500_c0_g1~~TRINITY_DN1500_c0_g1_i2.p1  ORF type:complete len:430 (-),score=76.30 TRINITY_DN1500_c0_g1_i2:315-1604(-)
MLKKKIYLEQDEQSLQIEQMLNWEDRKKYPQIFSKIEQLFKSGIPSAVRYDIWLLVLKKINLKKQILSEIKTYNYCWNYYQKHPDPQENENNNQDSYSYSDILASAKEQIPYMQQQQIRDDVELYRINNLHNGMNSQIIQNVLLSYLLIASTLSSNKNFIITYSYHLIEVCNILYLLVTQKQELPTNDGSFDKNSNQNVNDKNIQTKIEEDIFWLLISIINNPLKNYYQYQNQIEEEKQSHTKINKHNQFLTQLHLQNPRLTGIKADIILLDIIIKEYLPELSNKFIEFSLPVIEVLFADQLLCMFANLFNIELVLRIWDLIIYESTQPQENYPNMILFSVVLTLLNVCKEEIMNCKFIDDIKQILQQVGIYQIQTEQFINQVLENKKKLIQNQSYHIETLQNFDQKCQEQYAKEQKKKQNFSRPIFLN